MTRECDDLSEWISKTFPHVFSLTDIDWIFRKTITHTHKGASFDIDHMWIVESKSWEAPHKWTQDRSLTFLDQLVRRGAAKTKGQRADIITALLQDENGFPRKVRYYGFHRLECEFGHPEMVRYGQLGWTKWDGVCIDPATVRALMQVDVHPVTFKPLSKYYIHHALSTAQIAQRSQLEIPV